MSDENKPLDAKDNNKPKDEEPEEEEGGCAKCWNGYCACVVAVCKVSSKLFIFLQRSKNNNNSEINPMKIFIHSL